jgi:hypothetical protein
MTPIELKELLPLLLVDEIGTYIDSNGSTIGQAITFTSENQEQKSRSADGLELIFCSRSTLGLRSDQERNIRDINGNVAPFEISLISLIQHKTSGRPKLSTAIRKLQSHFTNRTGIFVLRERETSSPEKGLKYEMTLWPLDPI